MLNIISQITKPTPQAPCVLLLNSSSEFLIYSNITSLQGHWFTVSAMTFVQLSSLISPDRMQ